MKDEIDVVLYHGNCHDGTTSAAIVYLYYEQQGFRHPRYIPLFHDGSSKIEDDDIYDKNVYILDWAFDLVEDYIHIETISRSVFMIDHHEKNRELLKEIYRGIMDCSECGCTLTWQHFFPEERIPLFCEYIKDEDNLEWEYREESEALYYYLNVQEKTVENFCLLLQGNLDHMITVGKSIFEDKQKYIDYYVERSVRVEKKVNNISYMVECVRVPSESLYNGISEKLMRRPKIDFVMLYRPCSKGYKVSLRSKKVDVNKLAYYLGGGGGHRNAAGYIIQETGIEPARF